MVKGNTIKVNEIVFKDGRNIKCAEAFLSDRFLIVANEHEGISSAPDFYNLDLVAELHGAEELRTRASGIGTF